MVDYRGFTIQPKRDFGSYGFFIDGRYIKRGYVVVKDNCNVMPAATWFMTIEDAKEAIDILIDVGGDDIWNRETGYGDRFWKRIYARNDARKAFSVPNEEIEL